MADLKEEGEPEAQINHSHTRIIKLGRTLYCVQENGENHWRKCSVYMCPHLLINMDPHLQMNRFSLKSVCGLIMCTQGDQE